ncbi:hypothetical protein AC579_3229 [Lecanosticta acicola]|uniref:Nudix hydrolase domain-containing protein n=1 Tax=Lecanosticta acicola TaxID=111012 RepID=A0AAI8YZD4_9PEZI|nr:hypothetical protein AC579_3229 [Lecanosticta acicola]
MAKVTPRRSFLPVVHASDNFPYGPVDSAYYYQLFLPDDDEPHGYMLPAIVDKMPWTAAFAISHEPPRSVSVRDRSSKKGQNAAWAVNVAFQELVDACIARDSFHVLAGRHSEPFAVLGARYDSPVSVERFATTLFGLTTRGVHLVAYTTGMGMGTGVEREKEKEIDKIWIARRARHLYSYPDMLDSTVAGGLKAGALPLQAILEEADEEASFAEDFVREQIRSRGVLSHMSVTGKGMPGEQGLVNPDYIYVYDMELPGDVVPKPQDDEVNRFYGMTVDQVREALLNGEFKPDSGAVLVDFFIRHGIVTPENEENFVEINMRLHRRLPFRIA